MKILITNLGTVTDNIQSSSILKRLKRRMEKTEITWCVKQNDHKNIFKYNKSIDKVISLEELINLEETFDLLINLDPFLPHKICNKIRIINTLGLGFNEKNDSFESVIKGNKQI